MQQLQTNFRFIEEEGYALISYYMAITVADRFPEFNTFCPNDTGFSCVHPCKSEPFPRCTRTLGRDDRAEAARLRTVLSCAAFDNANSMRLMEDYVKLCCCKRTHRATALDIRVVERVAQRWAEQLYGPQAFFGGYGSVTTKQSFGEDRPGKHIFTGQHHITNNHTHRAAASAYDRARSFDGAY